MSLKEFDAKQFLLEKGEQVGLGVAVTLMVLILILSLFWPGPGFFSGSPATKAKELNQQTDRLETALQSAQPGTNDKPEERGKDKLIALDTQILDPDKFASGMWFEPRMREDKSRRPPDILPIAEAVAEVAAVSIDTYVLRFNNNAPKIMVLEDKDKPAAGGLGGMSNPFSRLKGGMPGGMPSMPGGMPPGGNSINNFMSQMRQGKASGAGSLYGIGGMAAGNPEYKTQWISVDDWNPQQLTAHQLMPLRMTIIAASFPYKKQLEEHKVKLRLKGLDEVLNEPLGEGEKKTAAFDFRGVDAERIEVDADGKATGDWVRLPLKESYKVWLEQSFFPLQPENPKYEMVRPNGGAGLVMPLLREFHVDKVTAPGLPPGFIPGMPLGAQQKQAETPAEEKTSKYPDVASKLPKIQDTLDKLRNAQPKQVAAPKFQKPQLFDAFNPQAAPPSENANTTTTATAGGEQVYPDYVLVRVVDVTIQPGKRYRYRLKMKMANPNYQNANVASPEYKEKETLESKEWFEMDQIVSVPQETFYYVVDEMQGISRRDLLTLPRESAQYRLLNQRNPLPDQVVFQFHRWVEVTLANRKESNPTPVGEWAVADRVFVSRGEYVGRIVNVDLPIWKYNQNAFILPVEDQKVRPGKSPKTGIDVEFGQDPAENNLILVDFEGGRLSIPSPFGAKKNIDDTSAVEVLMLSPDGKLLARNSTKDSADKDRKDRRDEVFKRILEIRAGK